MGVEETRDGIRFERFLVKGSGPKLACAMVSHIGRVRRRNEDAYGHIGRLLVVADGVGSRPSGHHAARLATHAICRRVGNRELRNPSATLCEAFAVAEQRIQAVSASDWRRHGMATTVAALFFGRNEITIAHVGDSRVYRARDGLVECLTVDHSTAGEFVRNGVVDDAGHWRSFGALTRCLGGPQFEPEIAMDGLYPGDRLLICTDGLTNAIEPRWLRFVLGQDTTPGAQAFMLAELALDNGAPDNLTFGVVHVHAEDVITQQIAV